MNVDRIVTKGSPTERKRKVSGTLSPGALISAAVALVVVVGMLVVYLSVQREQAPPVQPTSQPAVASQPTAPPTAIPSSPTPSDAAIAPYVALIHAQEAAGRWDMAATEAENALMLPELSDSNRKILTRYAISDGLKDLSTQVFRPLDTAQHQAMIDRYLALKQRAQDAGVAIDTPLQVATAAFSSSQFPLARVAIEEALKEGSYKPETDLDITKLYISTIYGIGNWYVTAEKDSPLYKEGRRWLVASDRIAIKFQTGQSEAEALLAQLGYTTDRQKWPPAATTPLLQ